MPTPTIILCPGQGAQALGMGKDFAETNPAARQTFELANDVLGFDLASICFSGPDDRLNQTDISQPAIYTTSVACFRAAEAVGKLERSGVTALAGLSLGEYTALHLAGAFGFEDGLRLVAARGRLMQQAAVASPSGMVALLGADEPAAEKLCADCAAGEVLVCANFNAPGQIVASGSLGACQRLLSAAESAGLKAVALKVAGAFHSPLMQSAADRMRDELSKVNFAPLSAPVYSNVTAEPHTSADSIRQLLFEQIVKPVRWEQTLRTLLAREGTRFVELAPGRSLAGMAKRINRRLQIESFSEASALTS